VTRVGALRMTNAERRAGDHVTSIM